MLHTSPSCCLVTTSPPLHLATLPLSWTIAPDLLSPQASASPSPSSFSAMTLLPDSLRKQTSTHTPTTPFHLPPPVLTPRASLLLVWIYQPRPGAAPPPLHWIPTALTCSKKSLQACHRFLPQRHFPFHLIISITMRTCSYYLPLPTVPPATALFLYSAQNSSEELFIPHSSSSSLATRFCPPSPAIPWKLLFEVTKDPGTHKPVLFSLSSF